MFNSVVLDVVIGLVFIYLLYSLLATIIQEIIASYFGFRAKILERAVFRMLEDETKFNFKLSSIWYLFKKKGNGGDQNSTSHEFYNHPLIKFLGENKAQSKPAYIDKSTFSKVLIDMLRGDQIEPGDDVRPLIQKALNQQATNWGNTKISPETLKYLKSIWVDAQGDVEKYKVYLENWFDATMERASGWYKKHTQFILFFVGLAIAIVFNVDTIKIVEKLEKDPKLREQLVQQAGAFVESHPDLNTELSLQQAKFDALKSKINNKILPLSDSVQKIKAEDSVHIAKTEALISHRDALVKRADSLINTDIKKANDLLGLGLKAYECNCKDKSISWYKSKYISCFFLSLFGWTITALALSLGAPFWFDLLNKLMKLRGSVATPTSDDREKKQG